MLGNWSLGDYFFPTELEWRIVVGIWALGLMVFTLGIKIAVEVFRDRMHVDAQGAQVEA